MKKSSFLNVIASLMFMVALAISPSNAHAYQIDEINTTINTLENRPVKVSVMTPDGYEKGNKHYPVLYINDGQDVFRDEQTFRKAASLRYEDYYQHYGAFMPKVILVAIEAPNDPGLRTKEYSPYTKNFVVPAGKKFEPRIEGQGKEYLQWLTGELKPMIDKKYRTMADRDNTGICGYSTGGLNSIYAALSYPKVFGRLIAMSSAVCIWMDCLQPTLDNSDYSHLKYVYMDVGTNEFGRMTTKEEFLQGANDLYQNYLKHGVPAKAIRYNIYPNAKHNQLEWRYRFPDAIRWVFQDKAGKN